MSQIDEESQLDEETEIVSQDEDIVFTGQSCSSAATQNDINQANNVEEMVQEAEKSFDPDATFLDESLLASKLKSPSGIPVTVAGERGTNDSTLGDTGLSFEKSNLSCVSQISTQPLTPSQDIQQSPPNMDYVSPDISPSQFIQTPVSQKDIKNQESQAVQESYSEKYNKSETNKLKLSSDNTLDQDSQSSLKMALSAVSSSSSSSCVASSSSSSKRPTESDDTDDTIGSQDIFESQNNAGSLEKNIVTTSQFIPTLQLSGDIPSSQSYEGFAPKRLHVSSPTSGSTSTPLRLSQKMAFDDSKGDVIALSDEEDIQKLTEKRKLSDLSSDDSKSEVKKKKKLCMDTRQSIVVVQEFKSPFKKPSVLGSQNLTLGSQAFELHLSQSESGGQGFEDLPCQESPSGSAKKIMESPETVFLGGNEESKTTEHDDSIVQLDDVEDEIQLISPPVKKTSKIGEILLDSPQPVLSTSGDILVLSPARGGTLGSKDIKSDVKSICGSNIDDLLSNKQGNNHNLPSIPTEKPYGSVLQSRLSRKDNTQDLGNASKESFQSPIPTNVQKFKNDFIFTHTYTFRVSCETDIDMVKREASRNTVSAFEVLENKTIVKRDSSPSAVEESSPGRGCGSPGSTVSIPGPFPLQPSHSTRLTMFSTTSSSSVGSSASTYHQAASQRFHGLPQLPQRKLKNSPADLKGLVPWKDLLYQHHDDLTALVSSSASEIIDGWTASCISNTSSDDSKTTDEKGLNPVLEDDDEEVLGVPKAGSKKLVLSSAIKKIRRGCSSSNNTSGSNSAQKEPPIEDKKPDGELSNSRRKRGRPPKANTPAGTPKSSTKKKAATLKTKDPTPLSKAVEQSSMPDDSLSSGSFYFTPGSQVFALWNKCYYPGRLESPARGDQWNVVFHDGKKKAMSKKKIILINTFEIGQSVGASVGDNSYERGTVVAVTPLEKCEDLYTIDLDTSKQTITVPMSELYLQEDQISQYLSGRPESSTSTSSSPNKRASASKMCSSDHEILKNLDLLHDLPGKRVRTPKGGQTIGSSPGRPGPSNTARRLITDGYEHRVDSSTAEDEPLATALGREKGPYFIVAGVEPEQVGFGSADPLARKGKGIKNSASKKPLPELEDENTIRQLGPMPPNGSKIFAGFTFILTHTEVKPNAKKEPVSDSDTQDQSESDESSHYASDSENFKFTHGPMVKDRLASQIIQGGGKVLKDWSEIVTKDINKTFVVSNRPCLTPIYIHCLARGIKSVRHDYIVERCKKNEKFMVLNSTYLAVGYSHLKMDFVRWDEHKCKSPLANEHILVAGDDKNFKIFWEEVLKAAGAGLSSVKTSKGLKSGNVTKVLSTNSNDIPIVNHALTCGIPIVSPFWVTQSLIANEALSPDAHPRFCFDYCDMD